MYVCCMLDVLIEEQIEINTSSIVYASMQFIVQYSHSFRGLLIGAFVKFLSQKFLAIIS